MPAPTDPAVLAWLDQEDRYTAQIIRTYGVYLQYVGGEPERRTPSLAYTVGLFGLGHPEVLIFSVSPETAGGVLNDIADRVRGGEDLAPGEILTFDRWAHRVLIEKVPNPGEIVFAANRFYERPAAFSVPVLQLTYDDRAGRFPTEPGYGNEDWLQPRPGTFRA